MQRRQRLDQGLQSQFHDLAPSKLQTEPCVGRFGWKAQQPTLLAFGADAYLNEMGITNDLFRNEVAPGIDPETLQLCDLIPDPEDRRDPLTGLRGIDAFEAFLKVLAPIERASPGNPAVDQEAASLSSFVNRLRDN